MHFSQLRYGLAVLALTLALLIMQLLDPLMSGQKSPFLVVLAITVVLSAWYGGMRTGLFATVLVAFAYDYFFASPGYSLLGINSKENLQFSLFLSEGVLISWFARLVRGLKLPTQMNTLKIQQAQNTKDQDIKLLQTCYQLICEQTSNIVLFLRRDGRIIAANQAAVKAYGYSQEELLSLKLQDLTVANDSVDLEKMVQTDNQGALGEIIHRHKDGKTFPVEVSVQSPVIGQEKVFLSIIRHITEQQTTPPLPGEQQYQVLADAMAYTAREVALRESEEQFRTMVDSAPVLLWVAGTDGLCTFFNQRWLTFRGRTLAQELGNGWAEGIHREDQQNCLDVYEAAFQSRQNFEREFRLLRADGEYCWVVDRGTPRFLPDGSFVGYVGFCTDITEQKATEQALHDRTRELATLRTVLAETNAALGKRNRELDQFVYAASHDLKAPLRAIAHLSSWIEEDTQDLLSEETRHQMNLLRGRVNRMEALIEALLLYSRIDRMKPLVERVSVEELLAAIIDSLSLPPEFIITIRGTMPTLETEKTLLEQVFTNLISNGIKHHNRLDGKITISIQEQEDFWEFAIADDGLGIDPQYHDKIFMMFQTLKARDKVENMGVGLAIVKKIIENKGGKIRLESQIGQGATFYFTWPKRNNE